MTGWRYEKQRGAMALLFSCFILPVMLFLFALAADVELYLSARSKAQILADEAVMYGRRYLPYHAEAEFAVRTYLERFFDARANMRVGIDRGSVSVVLRAPVELYFSRLLSLLARTGSETQSFITVVSIATGVPLDIFVALDTGRGLAPSAPLGAPWGDVSAWPAADFFRQLRPDLSDHIQRLLTQQCFNPGLNAAKHSAIRVLEYLSASPRNTVGFGFFPGTGTPYDIVRSTAHVRGGELRGDLAFFPYRGDFAASEQCAAAAEREAAQEHYSFPIRSSKLPPPRYDTSGAPTITLGTDGSWNPDYIPFLSASEAIWSRAVDQSRSGSAADALTMIHSQLFSADSGGTDRKGLSGQARKLGIILAGDLPQEGPLRFPADSVSNAISKRVEHLLAHLEEYAIDMRLVYAFFKHPGNEVVCSRNQAELQRFFSELTESRGRLVVDVYCSGSPIEFSDRLAGLIALKDNTGVLEY